MEGSVAAAAGAAGLAGWAGFAADGSAALVHVVQIDTSSITMQSRNFDMSFMISLMRRAAVAEFACER